jgi:hypothetical protein
LRLPCVVICHPWLPPLPPFPIPCCTSSCN